MIATDTSLDLTTLVGPLDALPCEIEDHEDTADWYATCRACGYTIAFCDGWLRELRADAAAGRRIECNDCGRRAATVDMLAILTPIRGTNP